MGTHPPSIMLHLTTLVIAFLSLASAQYNREVAEVDLSVGVGRQQMLEVDGQKKVSNIAGSLVQDVKQINLFLDIPDNCNDVYNGLIEQLSNCREGSNRGDPRLARGCLLRLDFARFKQVCGEEAGNGGNLYFPTVGETPFHPTPGCSGEYCREDGPVWSSSKTTIQKQVGASNVDFPGPNSGRPSNNPTGPSRPSNNPTQEEFDPSYTPPGRDQNPPKRVIQEGSTVNIWDIISNPQGNQQYGK